MTAQKDDAVKLVTFLLFCASITLRVFAFPYSNHDLKIFNLVWYDTLYHGIARALVTGFSNYALVPHFNMANRIGFPLPLDDHQRSCVDENRKVKIGIILLYESFPLV